MRCSPRPRAVNLICLSLLLLGPTGCKRSKETPDAGPSAKGLFRDRVLGFEFQLGPDWTPTGRPDVLLEARRDGSTTLVAPKLVVRQTPTDEWQDIEALARGAVEQLRALEATGGIRLERSTLAKRLVGQVEVGVVDLNYVVLNPGGGEDQRMFQRNLIAKRPSPRGIHEVTISFTYPENAPPSVRDEVDQMMRGVRFIKPSPAAPSDGGASRAPANP